METKDWIYAGGLILTFGVSLVSLIISIRNRKNAIRENLYREQLQFFLKFRGELAAITDYFDDISEQTELNKVDSQNCLKHIHHLDFLFESNDFLIPNDLFTLIGDTVTHCYKFHALLIKKGNTISEQEKDMFENVFYDMEDAVRAFLGIDNLSNENRKVIGKIEDE